MSRSIPTEYPDFPAVAPLQFFGDEFRPEYKKIGELTGEEIDFGDVLRQRAAVLGRDLDEVIGMLSGTGRPANFQFIANVLGTLIKTERVEKMLNYQKFFNFVELLHNQKQQLTDLAPSLPTSDRHRLLKIIANIPLITSHLRVTPMGPEPNQVNAMCKTQFDKRTGSAQLDQCGTVYDMCRGKQDQYGVIDHKRDLLCNRYIKKRVFPTEAARDPDVKKYFMNYNYARDGDEYLAPFVTQHDWQTEYNLNNGLLKQWDTTYGTNYADRGVRSGEDHQAAFGRMIDARPQQASSRVQASRSAYEDQAAKEAAAAAWEAERKGRQLAQLKQGILSPKLSPVASPGRRRSVAEITAGFGSRGKQVLPRTSASSVQLRAVTPRATPRRQASPQRAVQLRRVATPNRGTPRRGKTPVRATPSRR